MPNNTVPVSFELNNLLKRLNYTFSIEGLGGNWPATVAPVSGEFSASAKSGTIDAAVSFCATTGSCIGDTDLLPYDMAKKCSFDQSQVFTFVRLKAVSIDDSSISVYSDPVYVVCDDCLPNGKTSIPTGVILNNRGLDSLEFTAKIDGLIPKEKYNFIYKAINNNWPVKIYPISGTILPSSGSYMLPSKLIFCNSTGICNNNDDNILPYNADQECLINNYSARIMLHIEPESCEYDSFDSNIMLVVCDDCLRNPISAIPSRISLNNSTNNYADFTAVISGIIPNKQYNYSFRTLESDWPVMLTNSTGAFQTPLDVYCLDNKIEFCANTGICLSGQKNVLNFNIPDNCLLEKNKHKSKIIMDITSAGCDDTIISSNIMTFECNDCYPPSTEISLLPEKLFLSKEESSDIVINISNITPNKKYIYRIETISSDWPIFCSNPSGYVLSQSSEISVISNILFCSSSGICPSGYEGVLNYNIVSKNYIPRYAESPKTEAFVIAKLISTDCLEEYYTSNEIVLECDDCANASGSIKITNIDVR